ncbi:MAG: FG-GAP-like repeat-containing protein [Planctomycetota bacterium]
MNPTALSVAAVLGLAATVSAQYRYTQQTGLMTGPVVRTEGVILVDVDGDTDLDVVFANGYVLSSSGQAIQQTLLINKVDQGLGFVDETASRLPLGAIKATLAIAFDVDGDGDKDLVFSCNGPSQQRLYINDGTGVFTDQSVARLGTLSIAAAGCAYGDVDQDGDYDLFFNDELTNGQLKLLRNDGTGHFTNITSTNVAAAPKTNQQDVVLFDVDNDFDLDVVNLGKSSGQQIFFNDGNGRFMTVTTSLLPAGTGLTYEGEAADLDHDGDLDLTMLSVSGLTDTVLRNNLVETGTLSFTSLTGALTGGNGEDDNEWIFVDCDDDGWLDIVNGSLQSNGEKLYVNNHAFSFARQTGFNGFSPVIDSTLDVAVGDLDGDGVFDIVTAQGESGNYTNRAYYGTGPADTHGPRFVNVEQLPALSTTPNGPWAVRATIQDSMVDDGETSVDTATLDWTITGLSGVTTGSTTMRFLGGLLFRGELVPPAGVITAGATVSFTLTATDRRGNATTTPQQTFTVCGLQQYGLGLGGTNTAVLTGSGSTSPGDTPTISWSQGGANSTGLIAVTFAPAFVTLPQGVLLVDGNALFTLLPLASDAAGGGQFGLPIPAWPFLAGLPVSMQILFDAPLLLTNGLEMVICP